MIKSIKTILAQDKEKFKVPNKVQDLIPIKCIQPTVSLATPCQTVGDIRRCIFCFPRF